MPVLRAGADALGQRFRQGLPDLQARAQAEGFDPGNLRRGFGSGHGGVVLVHAENGFQGADRGTGGEA